MSSAIVLENVVGLDWWRKLDVIANTEQDLEPFRKLVPAAKGTNLVVQKEAGAWHLHARAPMRGRIDLPVPLGIWPMVAWWIGDGKVSTAIIEGGAAFAVEFGLDPMAAFIKTIPAGAREFVEVHGITLIRADWVPDHFIAVARGGMQQLNGGRNG
jgi:hypothetical protein